MNAEPSQQQKTLTLHMEGLARDGGDLKASVFIDKLDALRSAHQETNRILSGVDKQTVDFLFPTCDITV